MGMGRDDGVTVEGTGGKNSVSRQGVTHHAGECLRGVVEVGGLSGGRVRSGACGGGCFSDQASQGGQVEPDVGLEGECLAPEVAVDGQSFEVPAFEGGIASLGGVAGAVVEAFPGWGAHGDVSHQADGVILEALSQVDELTVGMVEVGTLIGRIGSPCDGNDGGSVVGASVEAGPLVTLAVEVEAVGLEGIAEGADGTALVVVAAQRPEGLVPSLCSGQAWSVWWARRSTTRRAWSLA